MTNLNFNKQENLFNVCIRKDKYKDDVLKNNWINESFIWEERILEIIRGEKI